MREPKTAVLDESLCEVTGDVIAAMILGCLIQGGEGWVRASASDLGRTLFGGVSARTIRRKLAELEAAGLIESNKQGRKTEHRVQRTTLRARLEERGWRPLSGQNVRQEAQKPDRMSDNNPKPDKMSDNDHQKPDRMSGKSEKPDKMSGNNHEKPDKMSGKPIYINTGVVYDSKSTVVHGSKENGNRSGTYDARSKENGKGNGTYDARSKKNGTKKGKNKYYSWKHYDYTPEQWAEIKQLQIPAGENSATCLIAAYLTGLYHLHGKEPSIPASKYGKLCGQARNCLSYFTEQENGDEAKGFRRALEFVRWYIKHPTDSFFGREGYCTNLLFLTTTYQKYIVSPHGNRKRRPKSDAWLARNDDVGAVHTRQEARAVAGRRF